MTDPVPGTGALPVRRSYLVDTPALAGVVVEVDATREPSALAVLQAGLHELADGDRLAFGYRITAAGLGAWIGDRRVRITIWPAIVAADGTVTEDDPTDPEADVLVLDLDLRTERAALDDLVRVGRLIVAGPDQGPVPLVVDVDTELLADVLRTAAG